MDAVEGYHQLKSTPLEVACEHDDAQTARTEDASWSCFFGFSHSVAETLLAADAYWACHTALLDYARSEHPAALVYFRTTYEALVQTDRELRISRARLRVAAAEQELQQLRQRKGLRGAFLDGLLS